MLFTTCFVVLYPPCLFYPKSWNIFLSNFICKFFQDIIRLPKLFQFLQKPLAQFISVARASKSKEGYASIGGGSPLRQMTDAQVKILFTWLHYFPTMLCYQVFVKLVFYSVKIVKWFFCFCLFNHNVNNILDLLCYYIQFI